MAGPLVESRHIAATDWRELSLPGISSGPGDDRWLFLPQSAGGSIALPSGSAASSRQLHYQLSTHAASRLALADASLLSGQVGRGLVLQVPDQLFPALASHVDAAAGVLHLFVLTADKSLGMLTLPLPASAAAALAAAGGGRQGAQRASTSSSSSAAVGVLDALALCGLQRGSWRLVPLAGELAGLGLPSALTAADGHVVIASSSGSVACVSVAALQQAAAGGGGQPLPHGSVVQLHPNTLAAAVKRRLGFAACAAAVAAVPVHLPAAGHSSLLVVHQDTSVHQWFVGQQRQGLSTTLVADAAMQQLQPRRVVLAQPQQQPQQQQQQAAGAWDTLLVFDVGQADAGTHSDVRVLPLALAPAAPPTRPGGPAPARRLEPALPAPQPLQLEVSDASLLDAVVVGPQLLLLCSSAGSGGTFVAAFSTRDWSYAGRCQLLQQQQKAGSGSDWGSHMEVWAAALSAFPHATDPASHVLSQLLVPGQLCVSSLRAAVGYFGAQLSEGDVAEASLSQLQARVRAAVEVIAARNPSFPAARCWHMLFAKYCELWQQQHGLLGLYAAPGGWVGGVRAGGMLTALRPLSAAEKLAQSSTPAAIKEVLQAVGASSSSSASGGGAAAAAKVRLCLEAITQLLGQPALRVMTQLVMAGVPVEAQLLPAFVKLVLQGAPSEAAAAAAAAAASSAFGGDSNAAQRRLQEVQAQRQALLMSVQEHLRELPNALKTLSDVVRLAITTATHAAAQLRAAPDASAAASALAGQQPAVAVGSLLCGTALHALRASCTTLQQLLLLLGCVCQLGSLGSEPLTNADQASIAADMVVPAATALRSTALALWLCKTPAGAPVAGTAAAAAQTSAKGAGLPGPLLGLKTPSSSAASTPREPAAAVLSDAAGAPPLPPAGAGMGTWRLPLAAHLLPSFYAQQGSAAGSQAAGRGITELGGQLAVWLMLGAGSASLAVTALAADGGDAAAAGGQWLAAMVGAQAPGAGGGVGGSAAAAAAEASVQDARGLAGRAVLLGFQLFVAQEYAAMQRVALLVGGEAPSEPGLQFVLGLSVACSLKQQQRPALAGGSPSAQQQRGRGGGRDQAGTEQGPAAADGQLQTAVAHLQRAAAGLSGAEAGPLRLVLQLLRHQQRASGSSVAKAVAAMELDDGQPPADQQTGADASGSSEQEAGALLRLQFSKAVMMLFEQSGVKEGALAFARAALEQADRAYGPAQAELKLQQQAALYAHIFNYSFDVGRVQEAYAAALSNPRHDTAERDLRRLVLALVEQGELQQLLGLPWSGVLRLKRDGLVVPVPVVEVVIDRLESRAVYGDLSSHHPSSAYHVLYDFLVTWGNYKHAATTMLAFARRLRAAASAESSFAAGGRARSAAAVAEVQTAYGACITLLQTLGPEAWIDPNQRLLTSFAAPPPAPRSSGAAVAGSRSGGNDGSGSPFDVATGGSKKAARTGGGSATAAAPAPSVLSLPDLAREAQLFSAAAALHGRLPGLDVLGYQLTPEYVFEQLLGQGMLPEALQLAHVAWSGQGLVVQLEAAAATLAAAAAELQQGSALVVVAAQQQGGGGEAGGGANGNVDGMAADMAGGSSAAASALAGTVLGAAGPRYLGSRAAAAWSKLQELLALYDGFDCLSPGPSAGSSKGRRAGGVSLVGGLMRLAAVDGALRVQPRIALPAWLLAPFAPADADADAAAAGGGMAGGAADPAALLRLLLQHGRLVDAAQLVVAHIDAWQRRGVLGRVRALAVWLPLADIQLLHASLVSGAARARDCEAAREAELLGHTAELLGEAWTAHVAFVARDTAQLAASAAAGGGGMRLGGGGVFGGGSSSMAL